MKSVEDLLHKGRSDNFVVKALVAVAVCAETAVALLEKGNGEMDDDAKDALMVVNSMVMKLNAWETK